LVRSSLSTTLNLYFIVLPFLPWPPSPLVANRAFL